MVTKVNLFICSVSVLLFTFNNCSEYKSISSDSAEVGKNSNEPSIPASGFSVSNFDKVSMKLGESLSIKGSIQAAKDYNGSLELSIDRTSLDALGAAGGIDIELNPSILTISKGELAPIELKIKTESMAPSFDASNIKINVKDKQQNYSASMSVPIEVSAIFELKMLGPSSDPAKRWDRKNMLFSFRDHLGGLKLKFINYDTKGTHIVHGNGEVKHQDVRTPLEKAPQEGLIGGVYEVLIPQGTQGNGGFYYHDIEQAGDQRKLTFGETSLTIANQKLVDHQTFLENRKPSSNEKAKSGSCHDPVGVEL